MTYFRPLRPIELPYVFVPLLAVLDAWLVFVFIKNAWLIFGAP